MKKSTITLLTIFAGLLLIPVQAFSQDWQPMFNGKNLDGWTKLNGDAEYQVDGSTITGIARLNTPNTFLTTEKTYGDFILEFDVKVDARLNSGVQIRSESTQDYMDGRVHGYQIEIDPSDRAWSGGIYDEARRGWLYPITKNEECADAFHNGLWNHYRVEAVGKELKTWVNGTQCAFVYDDMTPEGFIALQVHSVHEDELDGATVQWKDVKIMTENLAENRWKQDPDVEVANWVPDELTEMEKRHGWRFLWDGKTTNGWRQANSEEFPEQGWVIEGGTLTVLESGGGESRFAGDIVTEQEFSDFEFEVEFKITKGANSGIKYFVMEGLNPGSGSEIGPEFQILDNDNHPDAKMGVAGNRTVGSLYDMITATNLSEADRDDIRFKGIGEWNKARIVANGNHVEHWLNNIKVVEYDRGSQIYRNLVQKSKYNVYDNFGEAESGHILLQDHGNRVSFRSIKVREL